MRSEISTRVLAAANLLLEIAEEAAVAEVDSVDILDIEDCADCLKELAKRLR